MTLAPHTHTGLKKKKHRSCTDVEGIHLAQNNNSQQNVAPGPFCQFAQ